MQREASRTAEIVGKAEPTNALGIAAKRDSAGHRYYSVTEAGRLLGVNRSTANRRPTVRLVDHNGRSRQFVAAEAVDAERKSLLDRLGATEAFDDMVSRAPHPDLLTRVVELEDLVSTLFAAQDLADEELELERRRGAAIRNSLRIQITPSIRND